MKNFRDLTVWDTAHQLTLATYRHTIGFPPEERYGLVSQIRRSAASIPANIAEGCGRRGNSEFHRFLTIAMGSASELEYHFLLAKDFDYVKPDVYEVSIAQSWRSNDCLRRCKAESTKSVQESKLPGNRSSRPRNQEGLLGSSREFVLY